MRLRAMNNALFFCFVSLSLTIALYVDMFVYDTYILVFFPILVLVFSLSVVGFIMSIQIVLKSINNGGVRTQ